MACEMQKIRWNIGSWVKKRAETGEKIDIKCVDEQEIAIKEDQVQWLYIYIVSYRTELGFLHFETQKKSGNEERNLGDCSDMASSGRIGRHLFNCKQGSNFTPKGPNGTYMHLISHSVTQNVYVYSQFKTGFICMCY